MKTLPTFQKNKFSDQLKGEHDIAAIGLLLIPLIEKHFKPFDGERCKITSGARSAKFDKVCKAFQADAEKVTSARIWIDADYSASVRFDINQPDNNTDCTVNYFKDSIYFGEVDTNSFMQTPTGNFTYKFNPSADNGLIERFESIQAVTFEQLMQAKDNVKQAKEALDSALASVPYAFKDLIK